MDAVLRLPGGDQPSCIFSAQIHGSSRWSQEAEKQNTMVLKDLMVERGLICSRDGNQSESVADFLAVAKKFYPYRDAVAILNACLYPKGVLSYS